VKIIVIFIQSDLTQEMKIKYELKSFAFINEEDEKEFIKNQKKKFNVKKKKDFKTSETQNNENEISDLEKIKNNNNTSNNIETLHLEPSTSNINNFNENFSDSEI
jgi:hypothetical protein